MVAKKRTITKRPANGTTLHALYTGDTKNFNKFTIISEGYVGGIYFPIKEDIKGKKCNVVLVTPTDSKWKSEMEKLIENTSNPKALGNLTKCLNANK